jgi:hypothetical protein
MYISVIKARHQQQEDDDNAAIAIMALALLGKRVHIQTLKTYLTCKDLMGNLQTNSAWSHMGLARNDRAFITVMGLDVATFEAILEHFDKAWTSSTIPRADVNTHGAPKPNQCSLDSAGGFALILHWLGSSMAAYTLQQIFSITTAVCAHNLLHAQQCLLSVLKDLKILQIMWPGCKEKFQQYSNMIERKYPLLTKCFGFIDGLNLPVNVSDDEEYVSSKPLLCLN